MTSTNPAVPVARLAWQAPVAVGLAAVALVALGLHPITITALYLAAVTPELVRRDLAEHRLPNRLVLPGVALGLAALGVEWVVDGAPPLVPLIAASAFAGFLLLLWLANGVGMGDVKLALLIGLASPMLTIAVLAPVIGFLIGGIAALALMIRRGRGARFAFGPFLLAGYWAAVALAAL